MLTSDKSIKLSGKFVTPENISIKVKLVRTTELGVTEVKKELKVVSELKSVSSSQGLEFIESARWKYEIKAASFE